MSRHTKRLSLALLVTSWVVSLLWLVGATNMTSSTFFLVGGSDALAKVARHSATLRWNVGLGVMLAQAIVQGLLWRQTRRFRLVVSLLPAVLGIVAIGGLNWSVFYDPHAQAVKAAAGGLVLDEVPLTLGDDGPCAKTVEVGDTQLVLNGHRLRLTCWPLPLESDELNEFLTTTRCP